LIFEEELFFEIVREARLLMSHRVSIEDGKVRVAIQDEIIEIEHIDPSVEEDDEEQETGEQSNVRADLITDAFHILLCYAHRRNLAKRQSIPQPISSKSKPMSTPLFILRPILVHLQHENIIQRTTRLLEMILQNHKGSTLNSNVEEEPDQDSASHTSYLGKLMFPPTSRYELETENGILVTIVTSSPLMVYLPLYDVTATLIGDKSTVISKAGFYEISELEDWINWILKRKVD
jgi:mediator of RNA polymerase II transcription subunit 17